MFELESKIKYDIQMIQDAGNDLSEYIVVLNGKKYFKTGDYNVYGVPIVFDLDAPIEFEFIVINKIEYKNIKKNKKEV